MGGWRREGELDHAQRLYNPRAELHGASRSIAPPGYSEEQYLQHHQQQHSSYQGSTSLNPSHRISGTRGKKAMRKTEMVPPPQEPKPMGRRLDTSPLFPHSLKFGAPVMPPSI